MGVPTCRGENDENGLQNDQSRDARRGCAVRHGQPAGEPAFGAFCPGAGRRHRRGLPGCGGQGDRADRGRQEFHRRRRHHPNQGHPHARADPGAAQRQQPLPQFHRDRPQTGDCRHQRQLPGRRPGARHGLSLPRGGERGGSRASRGSDRSHPRRGRDPAAAAADRPSQRARHDHDRQVRQIRKGLRADPGG